MGIFVEFLVLRKLDAIIQSNQSVNYYARPTRRERKAEKERQYQVELAAFQKRCDMEAANPALKVARLAREKAEMKVEKQKSCWDHVWGLCIFLGIFLCLALLFGSR